MLLRDSLLALVLALAPAVAAADLGGSDDGGGTDPLADVRERIEAGEYRAALELDPGQLGANEYLGELYLRTDRPQQARERLRVLDDACFFGCEAYDELEAAIRAYEEGRAD